jgi:hypothetical protein
MDRINSNDLGVAGIMGTALRELVESQLRKGLEHYGRHANDYNFDWSESSEEGCDFDYLDGTIDRFSGIRVFNESKTLIAEGWLDYVYVDTEDKLFVFWDYLNLVEDGQVEKVKTRSGIPAYIYEKLDSRTIEKCKNLNMKLED